MKNSVETLSLCSMALKEWACIVESLGLGSQSLIIRKGGIHEDHGVFKPEHPDFALFPTYEHQKESHLNAVGRQGLESLRLKTGLSEPDTVSLCYLARVQQVYWLDRLELIPVLANHQALNAEALEKRFKGGDRPGFYVLVLRVFRLRKVILLPRLPEYAGCRSWIQLNPPLETPALEPVLSLAEFTKQYSALTRLIG